MMRISCRVEPGFLALYVIAATTGCHRPEQWSFSGPRVYLIEGTPEEQSDGLRWVQQQLQKDEINAKLYTPDNWLKIVSDIDRDPDEEVILVGHGHGAFLCTQVVRHYAQEHKTKFIEAVITLDAYNKDWPHNANECGEKSPHTKPMCTPIGHNAMKVRNYCQTSADSAIWGSDLVSTRQSNIANDPPFCWYEDYWNRRSVTGQVLTEDVTGLGVRHVTIDNDRQLLQRIVTMCRKAAMSPYHYTPPEHHVDVHPEPLASE